MARGERQALGVVPVQVAEQERARGTAASPSSAAEAADPGARRRARALGGSPSRASATHDVLPPWRAKSCPGAGVEPRTPRTCTLTRALGSSRRCPSLTSASLSRSSSTLRASATLHGRDRDEGGRPPPTLEHGPLADEGAGAELGDLLAVDQHLDARRRAAGRSRRPPRPAR